jgi:hypothetical protein
MKWPGSMRQEAGLIAGERRPATIGIREQARSTT